MVRKLYRSLGAILLVVGAMRGAQAQQPAASDSVLVITHFDVGQGDATLIVTPERRRILIDAGPMGSGVAQRLKRAGIDTLDLVIASHNHADHIGGMPEVFATLVVLNYMENGIPHTTVTYQRALAAVSSERGLRFLEANDRVVTLGGAALRVLPPARLDSTQNNNSVGILVTFGRFTALYTGDAEQAQIGKWVREGKVANVTLVKASHHGSWNGATTALVSAAAPKVVVVPVGVANRYGHPSPYIIRAWTAASARVYRTDLHGTIEVSATRAGTFGVRTSRQP